MGVVVKVKKGGERGVVFEYARPFIISIRVFWLVKKSCGWRNCHSQRRIGWLRISVFRIGAESRRVMCEKEREKRKGE